MGTIWTPDLSQLEGPKYQRLAQALRLAVRAGDLAIGDKVPPVRDLAWRVEMTPGTVARAYTILTDEGVFEAGVGRGTFVAKPKTVMPAPIEIDAVPHNSDVTEGPINLYSPVLPDVGQVALIQQLMVGIAQNPPSGLMHYPSRAGFQHAREAVVSWLSQTPLGRIGQDDIVLSHGGQNGILLVLQAVLKGANPVIYMEDLSYPGFRRAAELLRAKVVPISVDSQGIDPDALVAAVKLHGPGVLCTSPEVNNPTLSFTPLERRREIVSISQRYNLQILDDDCYRLGPSRAPSYRMLAPERGWYVSSISKILTPALRIGFAVAPHGQIASLRRAAEHGFFGVATPLSDLTAQLLSHPQVHTLTERVEARFAKYVQIAVNELGRYDLNWRQDVPFLWLRLPTGWRASSFCLACDGLGVKIRPAEQYTCRESRAPHAVRIAINAAISHARFAHAMSLLRDLLDNPPDEIGF